MGPIEGSRARRVAAGTALFVSITGCAPVDEGTEPAVVRLTEGLTVAARAAEVEAPDPIEWRFDEAGLAAALARAQELVAEAADEVDEEAEAEQPAPEEVGEEEVEDPAPDPLTLATTGGFEAFMDISELEVRDDLLVGRTGEVPVLLVDVDAGDLDDDLFAIELEMRVSDGSRVALIPDRGDFDREEAEEFWRRSNAWMFSAEIEPGDELQTITVGLEHAPSRRASDVRRLLLQPADVSGAEFAIRSVRIITRREHLAQVPSGVSWQGLGEIWREALVLRAPASATVVRELPSNPWLELHVGTLEPQPVTFRVTLRVGEGAGDERVVQRRTVTTPDRWEDASIDLAEFAGELVQLELAVESDEPGTIGLFGTLAVRNRGAAPRALAGVEPPRGVILILADTLRRDHLDAYGYTRETAPTITRLANEGALFLDDVAQGSWTKVSVPSMLSSLYPATNGIVKATDRLPASVTTLAEAFQQAGYATFATSSVFFTGRLSNLQQGIDVLHEKASFPDVEHSGSKTARIYVDRLLEWIEEHRDVPFYARLHAFDPHSPFEPYAPYDGLWSAPDAKELHEADVETAEAWLEENDKEKEYMPAKDDLVAAGVDPDAFVAREVDWYDASIRAMDVEIARLFERLEQLGLVDDVLVAFVSDHGEEFLEHGQHFHGNTVYAEMTDVPLFLWGPGRVPAGRRISDTVQSIDLMPTLLDLCGLETPDEAQGQSLVPLMTDAGVWTSRPAFAEIRFADFTREPEPHETESFALVEGDWRLIHNVERAEGRPEYELYHRVEDPLDQRNLAADEPERVEALAHKLELWRTWAESLRLDAEGGAELSDAQRAELSTLGYGG